jgi:hypothetical protein
MMKISTNIKIYLYFNNINDRDVPMEDINYMINIYNLQENNDKHMTVLSFINGAGRISLPTPIEDWFIASNNQSLPTYKLLELLNGNININIAGITNTSRIIRILKYANKLEENFCINMPLDDVLNSMLNKLDYETIVELCKLTI